MLSISWLSPPLFTNSAGTDIVVGVLDDTWYLFRKPPVEAGSPRGAVALLPLLQEEYGGEFQNVVAMLTARLLAGHLSPSLVVTFPFQSLGLAALSTPFWADRLLPWLDSMPWYADGLVALRERADSSSLPQACRHRLRAFAKFALPALREPARVLFHLDGHHTKVLLIRTVGIGLADFGTCWDIPTGVIPRDLRKINSMVVVSRWRDGRLHVGRFVPAEWSNVEGTG